MHKKLSVLFIAALAALLSLSALPSAHADILFVNFHYAIDEYHATRAAADARGEHVLMVPNMSDAVWSRYQTLAQSADPTVQEQAWAMQDAYPVNGDVLDRVVADAEQAGREISSLVISGHSNGSSFWGNSGSAIDAQEFSEIFDRHPRSKQSISGIFLWGCYSLTVDKADLWRTNFATAGFILGFSGAAPLSTADDSPILLKDGLKKQHELLSKTSAVEVSRGFNHLADAHDTNSAAVINSYYTSNEISPIQLAGATQGCTTAAADINAGHLSYLQYYWGEIEIPEDEHHSPLRTYYSELQQYGYCHIVGGDDPKGVLQLIFFNNISKNFGRYFFAQIHEANRILSSYPDPANPLLIPNYFLDVVSRKDVGAMSGKILNYLRANSDKLSDSDQKTLNILNCAIGTYLYPVDQIPLSWITEKPTMAHMPEAPINGASWCG